MTRRRRDDSTIRIDAGSFAAPEPAEDLMGHFLVPREGLHEAVEIGEGGVDIGRGSGCRIVVADPRVSSTHCRLRLAHETVIVEDLGSTNGTFVSGWRINAATVLPVNAVLQVGPRHFRHEIHDRSEMARNAAVAEELEAAARHIEALIPAPVDEGPVCIHWRLLPSFRLGGDILGFGPAPGGRTSLFLVDVSGHGVRAALHSVSACNAIRGAALPGAGAGDPGALLSALNRTFRMDDHGGMYFTLWYGVYDPADRRLTYASAGHPPALLVTPGQAGIRRLRTAQPPIGTFDDVTWVPESVTLAPGATLYVFSDGVFEDSGADGRPLGLAWLEGLCLSGGGPLADEPARIESALRAATGGRRFEDDFSLVVARVP